MAEQRVYTYYFRKKKKYEENENIMYENGILYEGNVVRHLTIVIKYEDIYEYIPNQYQEFMIDFYNDGLSDDKSIIKDYVYQDGDEIKEFKEYEKLSNTLYGGQITYLDSIHQNTNISLYKIYNNIDNYRNDYIDDIDSIYQEYQVDEKNKLFYIPKTKFDEVVEGVLKYNTGQIYILEVILNKLPNGWSYAIEKEERLDDNDQNDYFYTLNDIKEQLNKLED